MIHPDNPQEQRPPTTSDAASITFLKPDEGRILADWARSEDVTVSGLSLPESAARSARVQAIVKEIDDLVGNRQSLVADDLEERMIALLVGQLDPKSQMRLEISRDIAQVTAEKDHLEGAELVRRLTTISGRTLGVAAGAEPASAAAATAPIENLSSAPSLAEAQAPAHATRARPIPRPTKSEPRKLSMIERLFGRR